MLAIVLHPAGDAATPALRSADGMDAGLSGDELPLDAGQEPLAFGQGQAQAGQGGEVAGPGYPQDIGAVLFSLRSEAHQSHDPGHVASTSPGKTGPTIPPSALAPPISRQSLHGYAKALILFGFFQRPIFAMPLMQLDSGWIRATRWRADAGQ